MCAGFNGSHWVACHTLSGAPLFPMIMQLATFLGQYPREVVVVELTHVYNADDEVLDVLREILNCLGLVMDDECRCVCNAYARLATLLVAVTVPLRCTCTCVRWRVCAVCGICMHAAQHHSLALCGTGRRSTSMWFCSPCTSARRAPAGDMCAPCGGTSQLRFRPTCTHACTVQCKGPRALAGGRRPFRSGGSTTTALCWSPMSSPAHKTGGVMLTQSKTRTPTPTISRRCGAITSGSWSRLCRRTAVSSSAPHLVLRL